MNFETAIARARERMQAHYKLDVWRGLDLSEIETSGAATVLALLATFEHEEQTPEEYARLCRLLADYMEAIGWPLPAEAAPAFAELMCGDIVPC